MHPHPHRSAKSFPVYRYLLPKRKPVALSPTVFRLTASRALRPNTRTETAREPKAASSDQGRLFRGPLARFSLAHTRSTPTTNLPASLHPAGGHPSHSARSPVVPKGTSQTPPRPSGHPRVNLAFRARASGQLPCLHPRTFETLLAFHTAHSLPTAWRERTRRLADQRQPFSIVTANRRFANLPYLHTYFPPVQPFYWTILPNPARLGFSSHYRWTAFWSARGLGTWHLALDDPRAGEDTSSMKPMVRRTCRPRTGGLK